MGQSSVSEVTPTSRSPIPISPAAPNYVESTHMKSPLEERETPMVADLEIKNKPEVASTAELFQTDETEADKIFSFCDVCNFSYKSCCPGYQSFEISEYNLRY